MKIGVVADTHGFIDPRLTERLAGVEAILHAGDAGPREILETLALIAPVYAVPGNTDSPLLNLPLTLRLFSRVALFPRAFLTAGTSRPYGPQT